MSRPRTLIWGEPSAADKKVTCGCNAGIIQTHSLSLLIAIQRSALFNAFVLS